MFRAIGFPAKSAWIALAFVIPLAIMIWQLWSAASTLIQSTRSELHGMDYLQTVTEFISSEQKYRQAAMSASPNLGDLQSKTAALFRAVEEKQKELGVEMKSAESFELLKKAQDVVAQKPVGANPDETFAAHTDVVDAALNLVNQIADGSKMTLDPEQDTYNLINLAVAMGQQELEYLTRLRDLGVVTLAEKAAPEERRDALLKALSLIEFLDAGYETSYKAGVEAYPEVARTMDMKGVDAARDAFMNALKKQVKIATPSGDAGAFLLLGNATFDTQATLNRQIEARLRSLLQQRIDRLYQSTYLELAASLVGVAIALYLMLAFYRVMTGGLKEVAAHLQQITDGNLTTAPKPWGSDEAAQLMTTMGEMQTSLRRIASVVLESAAGVNTASEEIASASHDLSRRTEASAASLEETSSNTETIAANVKHTATMVEGCTSIVKENAESASRGALVIKQVMSNMEEMRTSSNQIGEIIGVIEGIAFQTNILALNAAVEAARAGEEGRGFAVVASEVRALAGRSAAAAKEIKTLISASIARVETGNRVVAEAGESIGVIVVNADQVNALMHEIVVATREQTSGVSAVEAAIHGLDQNTQQNAALVEETAAAASALSSQAQRLSDEVGFFKLQ